MTGAATADKSCSRCGRGVEVERPEPGPFSSVLERIGVLCASCAADDEREERREEAERLRDRALERVARAGIPRTLRGLDWGDVAEDERGRREAKDAAQEWARMEGPAGLFLHGPVGTGKTRLAATAAYERIFRGDGLAWASVPTLLARATSDRGRDEATQVLVDGRRTVVLDDLTKVGGSRWAASQLYAAIDGRISEGAGLLVTSNVPPSALGRALGSEHGQAIASRLAESCRVVELGGRDRRLDWARDEAA